MYAVPLSAANAASHVTDPLVVAIIGATIAGLFAVANKVVDTTSARRTRRKGLYSEAFRVALAWKEALYRVRRRPTDKSGNYALVERFHDLQEQLDYHQGWLAMEDPTLAKAYRDLVAAVKTDTKEHIRHAWQETEGREPTDAIPPNEEHPKTRPQEEAFIKACRARLSVWRRAWRRVRQGAGWPKRTFSKAKRRDSVSARHEPPSGDAIPDGSSQQENQA